LIIRIHTHSKRFQNKIRPKQHLMCMQEAVILLVLLKGLRKYPRMKQSKVLLRRLIRLISREILKLIKWLNRIINLGRLVVMLTLVIAMWLVIIRVKWWLENLFLWGLEHRDKVERISAKIFLHNKQNIPKRKKIKSSTQPRLARHFFS